MSKGKVKFIEDTHKYMDESGDVYTSVTSLIGQFKESFNPQEAAEKASKNRKSKWYKVSPNDIIAAWNKENKRAIDLGKWYHSTMETALCAVDDVNGQCVYKPIIDEEGIKYSPPQTNLSYGIYPEHFIYLDSVKLCGQADRVEIDKDDNIHIIDFKSNKEIKDKAYVSWDGIKKMMKKPIQHLEDVTFTHYALQLSLYMYMIECQNRHLNPGTLTIHHVKFKLAGEDQYGYPIHARDLNGNPIVDEIVKYEMPYLKKEAKALINTLKK